MSRRMFHPTLLVLLAVAGLIAGGAESASSSSPPGKSSPSNSSLPSISGSAALGQTLSASVGSWAGPTPSYSYQWQRCDSSGNSCSAVGGGAASYGLTSGDVGATLRVTVTATNKNGSAVATSDPTSVVGGGGSTTTTGTTATTTTAPTTTGTTTTRTTTTGTTSTGTTGTTTTSSAGFTTSLSPNGTITTPYTWTFNPGVPTTAGYFWADGVLLATVTGPGPYSYTLQPGKLGPGTHTLGHAWDLSNGTHQTPPSAYTETIDATAPAGTTTTTSTPSSPPAGSLEFNGLATQMQSMSSTGYSSTNNLVQSQSPNVFDGLAYTNNDITLASDSAFGTVFNVSAEPGSRNPYNTGAPPNDAMAQLTKRQPTGLGTTEYYGIAVKIPSASWHNPDWASLMSLGYETFSWDQVALDVYPGSSGPNFDLMQNSGYLNCPSTTCAGTVSGQWTIAPVTYDKWFEFVFAVKWATDNSGFVRVYMRNPGGSWSLALDHENQPTYAYGASAYGTVSSDLHEVGSTTLDKFGLYYGYWSTATTSFPKNTIQESGLVRASSLAAAQAALP